MSYVEVIRLLGCAESKEFTKFHTVFLTVNHKIPKVLSLIGAAPIGRLFPSSCFSGLPFSPLLTLWPLTLNGSCFCPAIISRGIAQCQGVPFSLNTWCSTWLETPAIEEHGSAEQQSLFQVLGLSGLRTFFSTELLGLWLLMINNSTG